MLTVPTGKISDTRMQIVQIQAQNFQILPNKIPDAESMILHAI